MSNSCLKKQKTKTKSKTKHLNRHRVVQAYLNRFHISKSTSTGSGACCIDDKMVPQLFEHELLSGAYIKKEIPSFLRVPHASVILGP